MRVVVVPPNRADQLDLDERRRNHRLLLPSFVATSTSPTLVALADLLLRRPDLGEQRLWRVSSGLRQWWPWRVSSRSGRWRPWQASSGLGVVAAIAGEPGARGIGSYGRRAQSSGRWWPWWASMGSRSWRSSGLTPPQTWGGGAGSGRTLLGKRRAGLYFSEEDNIMAKRKKKINKMTCGPH